MSTPNKTFYTRVQFKTDTETNWDLAGAADTPFVPLTGEVIVYAPDYLHDYARLKIGNGEDTVTDLPFIDAGTINGLDVEIVRKYSYTLFPIPGSVNKLYLETSTRKIYYYDNSLGYLPLSEASFSLTTASGSIINSWSSGNATSITKSNHKLIIRNGTSPSLSYNNQTVVTNVT